MNKNWKPNSWRQFPIKQQPEYLDLVALEDVEKQLSLLPPLVFAGEVRNLESKLSDVSEGKAFLLQGGDCAESFSDFSANNLRDTFRVFLQMSVVLTFAASLPVIKVGRMAGQFAKPRSADFEKIDDVQLPAYRGDIINGMDFTELSRKANPSRMLRAYSQSASTLNLLRAFSSGGYADLNKVHQWTLDFIRGTDEEEKYYDLANSISDALNFMKACGINRDNVPEFKQVDFFTSHEALLLRYEESLTRIDSTSGNWYDCSAHMLWIGERTRSLEDAHVEFMKGIANPVGIKIGPNTEDEYLIRLLDILNPKNISGRITFITRMGSENIKVKLPKLLRKITSEGRKVVWSCDPMHANTFKASNGYKTRSFDKIADEIETFFTVHQAEGTVAGGIHLEMTGSDVTECIGGPQKIQEKNLSNRYDTQCDPRLNASQGLELAFRVSDALKKLNFNK